MQYNIKLEISADAPTLQVLIRVLDSGPHGVVRPLIDDIIRQAKEQEEAAKDSPQPDAEPTPVGGTD